MSFVEKWLQIIRNCSFDNTYKASWAKAITELAVEFKDDGSTERVEISLKSIAEKVLRFYFEQTIFFNLQQSSNPNKPPVILSIVQNLIKYYQQKTGSQKPVKWYKSNIENICPLELKKAIRDTVRALKTDVSYRFIRIEGKDVEGIYEYEQKEDSLFMSKDNLIALKENSLIVFDAINYRWVQMLEQFNHSPRLSKKVRIIDDEQIRRKPLGKFSTYLDSENPDHLCFLCREKIEYETPAVDHVIPWSYLYADDIWNLVYAHQTCNSSKSNVIPSEELIAKLEARNVQLLEQLRSKSIRDKHYAELEMAIDNNLVRKFWISCQG
ncbi:HNH endonuclease [Paenibacillus sp. Soil522]|uniref:HNH endonuclease n=1 Tax=Paenibacillus sp. Soil522 TaxID=1736388 RepID=UPI0006F24029|nr:HNH endonuclease signature motif containing protein [Paenibacillus sp. Soil522]KRE45824.1 HNH endonuclease [Paenibacillus sp. Soil522]